MRGQAARLTLVGPAATAGRGARREGQLRFELCYCRGVTGRERRCQDAGKSAVTFLLGAAQFQNLRLCGYGALESGCHCGDIIAHLCQFVKGELGQFLVSGFLFLVTPLVRGSSLGLSIEIPVLACGCLKQDAGGFLADFQDCKRAVGGWAAGLFCGGGKGRLQRDSDLGCTREIGSVPDFFEGFVKIAPAAAVWMHLIFPISWSSDWGQPYSGDHSDSSQLNPCALALSAFSCCSCFECSLFF